MARLQAAEDPPFFARPVALLILAAYGVVWIAALSVISVITGEINRAVPSPRVLALSGIVSAAVITIGIVQFARRRMGAGWGTALQVTHPTGRNTLLYIFLIGLGLAWSIDLLGVLLRLKGGQVIPPVMDSLREGNALAWLVAAVYAVFLQPLAESLVFAGIVYPTTARATGDTRFGIFSTAFLFLVVSLIMSPAPGTWYAAVQPFLMMIVVLCFRAYYQSTRAAVVARVAFGVFFILAAAFSGGFGG